MNNIDAIKKEVVVQLQNVFAAQLQEIILYGSYARGDFKEYSDIDFAVIVDISRDDISKYRNSLGHLMSEIGLKYDIFPSIHCIPYSEFAYWKKDLPYYMNIDKEGIRLNG
jgi:predicted nucleotidyltransferase